MRKKILGILVCTLFIGSILTCVNGIAVNQDLRMIVPSNIPETTSDDILFSDDFNDNQKDFNKWNEIYSNGTWEETNGRAEFKLIESGGTGVRSEGIQSKAIVAAIGGDEPWDNKVKVTWTMYPTIDATSSEGKIVMKITDGRNYIIMEYDRAGGVARFYDSLGNEEVFVGGDEPWENKLEIIGDRYFVTMNDWEATVYASIFPDRSITLKIQLFIELGGSTRTKYLRSGFDDIIVSQRTNDQHPNKPTIDGTNTGKPGTAYTYKFTSSDPETDDISYYIDWGDGSTTDWTTLQVSGSSYSESHTWNSKGTFIIKAKVKDKYGAESSWSQLTVTMPRYRAMNIQFLDYLQSHPNMFSVLQKLLNRLGQ